MVKDAEANAEEDHRIAELALARNQADALLHSTRKSLGEYVEKLDASDKEAIETALMELVETLKEGDKAITEAKVEGLFNATHQLGEKMYADMTEQARTEEHT